MNEEYDVENENVVHFDVSECQFFLTGNCRLTQVEIEITSHGFYCHTKRILRIYFIKRQAVSAKQRKVKKRKMRIFPCRKSVECHDL